MKKFKSKKLLQLRAIAAVSVLIMLSVFCLSGCSKGADTEKSKITVPASEVMKTMLPKIGDFEAKAEMSYSDAAYSVNFPTLYKGLELSDITDGAIIYDETGNTADEISILVAKDKDSTNTLKEALKQRALKRASDFGDYKPVEATKAETAKVVICDRYVMLAIGSDPTTMQKQYQLAMQAYSQENSDEDDN